MRELRTSTLFLTFAIAFLAPIVGGLFVMFSLYELYRDALPDAQTLEEYEPTLSTVVYDIHGEVLAELAGEKRTWVSLDSIPPVLIDALLSAEDKHFYSHWGVDLPAIFQAILQNIISGKIVRGASTITQQLARTLFLTRERTIARKVKEMLTAVKLERAYSKDEILEIFLNQNYMGRGAYGVQAASRLYFGKNVWEINTEEAALLAGVLKAPEYYTPVKYPERARRRRNTVLDMMVDNHKLDQETADSLKLIPVKSESFEGYGWKAPYFVEFVRQYLEKKYGEKFIYEKGLKVYTTLDYNMQKIAEKYFNENIDRLQHWIEKIHHPDDPDYTEVVFDSTVGDTVRRYKQLQGAMLAMDPRTGEIRVMIGGRDFTKSKFNRAVQALRQPGSAFKPFTFTTAIDNGYRPCDKIDDSPIVLKVGGKIWRPENYDKKYLGPISLRTALKKSKNMVAIRLIQRVTPKQVIKYARRMGISTPLKPVPSLAIGSCEVTMLDMVTAFCVFPNNGIKPTPIWVRKIEDREGNVIEENRPRMEEVLPAQTAYVMTNMLQTVVDHGTGWGVRAYGFDRPCGGKTGTTNDYTDAWFIGFIPQLVVGVHTHFDDMTPIGENQTGSRAALPVFAKFIIEATKGMERLDFTEPPGIVHARICNESLLLATRRCPDVSEEIFIKGTEPTSYCPLSHRKEDYVPSRFEEIEKQEEKPKPTIPGEEKKEERIRF
ncbi:PBP1A family penicillin-binding protein [bacterium]|nr:PBP1A family penicillin-binding protein [bacterium]